MKRRHAKLGQHHSMGWGVKQLVVSFHGMGCQTVGSIIPWDGVLNRIKRMRIEHQPWSCSAPYCICNVTRSLMNLPPNHLCSEALYPQTEPKHCPPSSNDFSQTLCHSSKKSNLNTMQTCCFVIVAFVCVSEGLWFWKHVHVSECVNMLIWVKE